MLPFTYNLNSQYMSKLTLPLTPSAIEYVLLGFVRHEATHGYDIYRQLAEVDGLGLVWRPKQSQLYALLNKLEADGLLAATLAYQETRPPRKLFHLTLSGTETFLAWVQTPVDHGRQFRLEFLGKLYFARREGTDAAANLLQRQKIVCQTWFDREQSSLNQVSPEHSFAYLVHTFRQGQIQAMLDWLAQCEQRLLVPSSPE